MKNCKNELTRKLNSIIKDADYGKSGHTIRQYENYAFRSLFDRAQKWFSTNDYDVVNKVLHGAQAFMKASSRMETRFSWTGAEMSVMSPIGSWQVNYNEVYIMYSDLDKGIHTVYRVPGITQDEVENMLSNAIIEWNGVKGYKRSVHANVYDFIFASKVVSVEVTTKEANSGLIKGPLTIISDWEHEEVFSDDFLIDQMKAGLYCSSDYKHIVVEDINTLCAYTE